MGAHRDVGTYSWGHIEIGAHRDDPFNFMKIVDCQELKGFPGFFSCVFKKGCS